MISGSTILITETQADSMFNTLATWFSSLLNLIIDFRYVFIMLFFFIVIVRLLRRKKEPYGGSQEITSDSRAVSGTGNKYGSTGGRAKSKGSIRNRFGFK